MALPYRIREASLDDNLGLIELVRRCPVQGTMQLILDRFPDYFAFTRMQGDRSYIYVAENGEGAIVGSVAFIESAAKTSGEERRVLRFSDLRTDPAYRGSRIAATFIEIYRKKLQEEGYDCGTAEILEGNLSPIKAQRLLGEAIRVVDEGFFEIFQMFPVWSYKASSDYTLRPAALTDLPAVVTLLQETYRTAGEAPPFSLEWLTNAFDQHLSFQIENLWLAEDAQGEIKACVATWDQKGLRRTLALRFSPFARLFVRLLGMLSLLWKLPPIPQEGGSLRFLYLRWPACKAGEEMALNALIKDVMRGVRQQGEHQFVVLGFHEQDNLKRCLNGIVRIKMRMHLYTHRVKADHSHSLTARNPAPFHYVDTALI